MPSRSLAVLVALAFLSSCGGHDSSPPSARAAKARLAGGARGWNVILLTIDTLRADRLGSYGYTARKTSPHLDAQLGSGVLFEQAMSQRAETWPSLATLLSGLYP